MTKRTTTTETIEYDKKGQVVKRTVVTTTEDVYNSGWWPTYPTIPYYTYPYSTTGNTSSTSGGTITFLTTNDDDDDDDGKAGVGA